MTKTNKHFSFKDVVIDYDAQGLLYAYYLSDDNKKNKEINDIIIDMGYTRNRLVKNYPLVEVQLGFEYKRMAIYINNEKLEELEAERDRRDNIRNADVL